MSVELLTSTAGVVTAKQYAIVQQKNTSNGVFYGCALTHLGSNQVGITAGLMNVEGRLVNVLAETILCELATSGTMLGRIYVKVDLADTETPVALLTVADTILPDLEQDADFNKTNGIWETELATYNASTTVISDLVTTVKDVVAIGNEDISGIGDGTIKGAILNLSDNITKLFKTATITLAQASWTGTTGAYTQTVTATGYLADEEPIKTLVPATFPKATTAEKAGQALIENWKCETNGNITAYASAIPTVALTFKLKGV